MRTRTKVGAVVSALLVLPLPAVSSMAIPAGAAGQSSVAATCSVERLSLPSGWHRGRVTGGDPLGRYLVGRTGDHTAVFWHGAEVGEVLEPPGTSVTYANDVNGSGIVVGNSLSDSDSDYHAWRHVDGEFTWLPEPDNAIATEAFAVNSRGDIVGSGIDEDRYYALYWPASEPDTVHVLEGPRSAGAYGISDDGVILGHWFATDGDGRGGYVWEDPNRRGRRLLGSTGGPATYPYMLRGHMVVGHDNPNPDGTEGARWNLDTGEITTYENEVSVVNSAGDVVSIRTWPAVIIRADGGTTKLAALDASRPRHAEVLLDPGSDLVAAGWARNEDKRRQPVVWRDC